MKKKYDYVHKLDSATWQIKADFKQVAKRVLRKLVREAVMCVGEKCDIDMPPWTAAEYKVEATRIAKELIP